MISYGETKQSALQAVKGLALHVIADKLEHGELEQEFEAVQFAQAA